MPLLLYMTLLLNFSPPMNVELELSILEFPLTSVEKDGLHELSKICMILQGSNENHMVTVLMIGCLAAPRTGFLVEIWQMLSQNKYFGGHGKPDPMETILFPLVWMDAQKHASWSPTLAGARGIMVSCSHPSLETTAALRLTTQLAFCVESNRLTSFLVDKATTEQRFHWEMEKFFSSTILPSNGIISSFYFRRRRATWAKTSPSRSSSSPTPSRPRSNGSSSSQLNQVKTWIKKNSIN